MRIPLFAFYGNLLAVGFAFSNGYRAPRVSFNGRIADTVASKKCIVPAYSVPFRKLAPPPSSRCDAQVDDNIEPKESSTSFARSLLFGGVGLIYWYWFVLGAAVLSYNLPGIPDFIPNVPGWPPSEQDLQPVVEDSYHFFYLSELLQTPDSPYVAPPRLAIFNIVEAWIFCLLPVLWKDRQRLPRPILLALWSTLGLALTNAFLAPYLFVTELRAPSTDDPPKNRVVSAVFGIIGSVIVAYAIGTCATAATMDEWNELAELVRTDRTYLAFSIDPILLSIFQPLLLARVKGTTALQPLDYVPFVGVIAWLLGGTTSNDDI